MSKRWLRWGVLAVMGILVLGAALPAMAAADSSSQAGLRQRAQSMIQVLADLTGKDISAIQDERQSGKSVLDIAAENGISEEKLTESITTANKTRLQTLLDEGKITQAQYDTCLTQMDQRIQERLTSNTTGGGCRGGNGPGLGNGQGRGQGQGRGMGPGSGTCWQTTDQQ